MNEKQKIYKREFIKKCIIAGKEHSIHYSNKILPPKYYSHVHLRTYD